MATYIHFCRMLTVVHHISTNLWTLSSISRLKVQYNELYVIRISALKNIVYSYNNQHVLVIRAFHNKNIFIIQIVVQKCMIKPLDFSVEFIMVINYWIMLSLKCSKIDCIYVVCLMCIVDLHPVRVSEVVYSRSNHWWSRAVPSVVLYQGVNQLYISNKQNKHILFYCILMTI